MQSTPRATPTALKEHHVTAMFDYVAQNPDELSFKQGQQIVVKDRSAVDWWKGSLVDDVTATIGLFPANYVTSSNDKPIQCECLVSC